MTPRSGVSVEEQLHQLMLTNFELSKKLLASETATISQVCTISPTLPSCDEFPMNVMAADSSCAVRAWETSVPRSALKGVKDPSCVDRIADDDNNACVYPQRGEFISVLKIQSKCPRTPVFSTDYVEPGIADRRCTPPWAYQFGNGADAIIGTSIC